MTALPPPSRQARISVPDASGPAFWSIPAETAIEVGCNGKPFVVMMATPADIEDLALGLAFTEQLIHDADCVTGVEIRVFPEGVTADLKVAPGGLRETAQRRRSLEGRTGCGLCGVETLAEAMRPVPEVGGDRIAIPDAAIAHAFGDLPDHQPLNRETRSVHAAAWCAPDGAILVIREDVGRHNALDKLVGALLRAPPDGPGFIAMTSRCSFELVYKAAAIHASLLATVSAPTGLALDLAAAASLPLACAGPGGAIVRFPGESSDA